MKNINVKLPAVLFLVINISLLFSYLPIKAQYFTWMTGAQQINQNGTYGTLGVPNTSNTPGARYQPCNWTDTLGNFWLFGGFGNGLSSSGNLNDLWKFNPILNEWTWMGGSGAINQAGSYGTKGVPAPSNIPGGRTTAASWVDLNGDFWLFSGQDAISNNYFSDLWKYTVSTNQWVWVSGSNLTNQPGVYGTLNAPAPTNIPGGRTQPITWVDANGDLWLFGGYGYSSQGTGYLNDVWKYKISSNEWTWIGGSNAVNQTGSYGQLNVPSPNNRPGGRAAAVAWKSADSLYLYGGNGYGASGNPAALSDFWKFDLSNSVWTHIAGSTQLNANPSYSLNGIPSSTATPGGRIAGVSWSGDNGDLWLFGGSSFSGFQNYNDLWRFNLRTKLWTWIKGANFQNQTAVYGPQYIASPVNIPGARLNHVAWKGLNNTFWLFGGIGYATASNGRLNDLWKYDYCEPISFSITSSNQIACAGETVTLTVLGAITHTWSDLTNLNTNVVSLVGDSVFSVFGIDGFGCLNSQSYTQKISPCTGISALEDERSTFYIYPSPTKDVLKFSNANTTNVGTLKIYNTVGEVILDVIPNADNNSINLNLPAGLYYFAYFENERIVKKGPLIISE